MLQRAIETTQSLKKEVRNHAMIKRDPELGREKTRIDGRELHRGPDAIFRAAIEMIEIVSVIVKAGEAVIEIENGANGKIVNDSPAVAEIPKEVNRHVLTVAVAVVVAVAVRAEVTERRVTDAIRKM